LVPQIQTPPPVSHRPQPPVAPPTIPVSPPPEIPESNGPKPHAKAIIGLVVVALLVTASTAAVLATQRDTKKTDDNQQVTKSITPTPSKTVAATATPTQSTSLQPTSSPSVSVAPKPAASSAAPAQPATEFKNGTYVATGYYNTPGGQEWVKVTVTLSSDAISGVSIQQSASQGDAGQYQSQFVANYKPLVLGKKIKSVSLSRVAGSSLTSNGFNNAINQIESKAS
jgi:hypothetical protein